MFSGVVFVTYVSPQTPYLAFLRYNAHAIYLTIFLYPAPAVPQS